MKKKQTNHLKNKLIQAEKRVYQLAYYDVVTDLPNRTLFEQEMTKAILNNEDQMLALIYLNIDRFKYINDTLGHKLGDQLLQQVALRLLDGEGYQVARVGGDEFAIYIERLAALDDIERIIQKIKRKLNQVFKINGYDVHITASMGVSIFPRDGEDAHTLLRSAHNALHNAKVKGKGNVRYFSASMNKKLNQLFFLENDLYKAFKNREFFLSYQPRVSVSTGEVVGAEALIRWKNSEGEIVNPIEFISLAEEIGLIIPISEWALKTVCEQNKNWQDMGLPPIPISVNLSAQHLLKENLAETVAEILDSTKLDPMYLEIELTENILIENPAETLNLLNALRNIGVKIALDDFGTGYCSLSYLKSIAMDIVKIDRSFVQNIPNDPVDTAIVSSVIKLAKILQKKVVAEGVETEEQLHFLYEKHCDEIQGYLYSKPLTTENFSKLLEGEEQLLHQSTELLDNRRKYLRIQFSRSPLANLSIHAFNGQEHLLDQVNISINDIAIGGLRLTTDVHLNANPEILYRISTSFAEQTVVLLGNIVWGKELGNNQYEYGLEFLLTEEQRKWLATVIENTQQ